MESAWQLSFPSLLNRHVTHSTVADTGVSQTQSLLFRGHELEVETQSVGSSPAQPDKSSRGSGGGVGRHTPPAYGAGTQRREAESALLSHLHTEGGTSVALQSGTCEGRGKVRKGKVYSHSFISPWLTSFPGRLGLPAAAGVSQQPGNRHTAPAESRGGTGWWDAGSRPVREVLPRKEPLLSSCLGRHRSRGLNLNLLICPSSHISKQVCTFHRWGNAGVRAESRCQNLTPGLPDSKAQVS